MAATDYPTLIARLRAEGHDTATSNGKYLEVPRGQRDGTNKVFKLDNQNIVSGSAYVTYGSNIRQPAAGTFPFTLDATNGLVTFTTAPDAAGASATQPFYLDYNFQWCTDTEYTAFIDASSQELGSPAGTATVEGLYPALMKYALERYWLRRSTLWATSYGSSGGGASVDANNPTKAFLELAKAARKAGDDLLKSYYQSQGQQLRPASGIVSYKIDPWTPKR